MNEKKILVIGSVNVDHVLRVNKLPKPGQTVSGNGYEIGAGGKGANQAVACARLGGNTSFIANVGEDLLGSSMVEQFAREGIDTSLIKKIDSVKTGVALILVDAAAENVIGLSGGANDTVSVSQINLQEEAIAAADYLLVQLEVPLATVEAVAELSRKHETPLVLNPAPAVKLSDALLSKIDILTPNQTEAEVLTGIQVRDQSGAEKAAQYLHGKGVRVVIITLGGDGVFFSCEGESLVVPGIKVAPVDTTAAGDAFNGAYLAGLARGLSEVKALLFANHCAAISVTRPGAQPSIPYFSEVQKIFESLSDGRVP